MIRGLEKIKSIKDYESIKDGLEYCIREYKWISECEDPKKEVEEQLIACSNKLTSEMDKAKELELLKQIHLLKTKHISIERDEYKPTLKRNINAFVLMLEQYEASKEEFKFTDIVKGIITGNPNVKEHLKKKYMFSFANMYGTTPAPESLNVESMDDILEYMDRNYELVDIDLSDRKDTKEELGLVLFEEPVVGMKAKVLSTIGKTVDDCIEKYSTSSPSREEVKTALRNMENNKENVYDKHYVEDKKERTSKTEGEFER